YNAASNIGGQDRPHIDTGTAFPAVALPSLMSGLSRSRNGMKSPQQPARPHVKSSHVTGCPECWSFLHPAAGDDDISDNQDRRGKPDKGVGKSIQHLSGLQVGPPLIPETFNRFASVCIQRNQEAASTARDDAGFCAFFARPIRQTSG